MYSTSAACVLKLGKGPSYLDRACSLPFYSCPILYTHAHLYTKMYKSLHVGCIHSMVVKSLDSEFRHLELKSCLSLARHVTLGK